MENTPTHPTEKINQSKTMTPETPEVLVPYEYGAMTSKFSLMAANKLTAYATMVVHYAQSANMILIYSPESSKKDRWTNLYGSISERLDEIFGGEGEFDTYLETHHEEIATCHNSIRRIV